VTARAWHIAIGGAGGCLLLFGLVLVWRGEAEAGMRWSYDGVIALVLAVASGVQREQL
jgi:hypothetical protein